MILVLANRTDETAAIAVERWYDAGARIILPEMLFARGIGYRAGGHERPRAIFGDDPHSSSIRGVLVRMHAVLPSDLVHVRAADRAYVAAEMTAFLLAWLTALPCTVLGRPSATSLAGPELRPEQWIHLAANVDVPVRPVHRSSRSNDIDDKPLPLTAVTIVGETCIRAPSEILAQRALRVARAANARLLTTYFDGISDDAVFVRAQPWVDLDDPAIESAVFLQLSGTAKQEVAS